MKNLLPPLAGLFLLGVSVTATAQPTPTVIPLWENGAPGFEDRKNEPESAKDWWIKNIHNPSVTVYRPADSMATRLAVVVFPGGGFRELVFNPEGRDAGEYLAGIGVTAFAVKYRLPNEEGSPYSIEHALEDAHRAMRLVRSRADEFRVDPSRIGVMGFSAGAYLAARLSFEEGGGDPSASDTVDTVSSHPDFQVLIYPAPESVPDRISESTPPTFVLAAIDDECCGASSVQILEALFEAGVPVEGHIYAQGDHAFNMGYRSDLRSISGWPERLHDWLLDNVATQ